MHGVSLYKRGSFIACLMQIELLQKRVKILEGQNIKLRLAQGSYEEKQSAQPARSRRPYSAGGHPGRGAAVESEGFDLSAESSEENNGARAENLPPNDGLGVGQAGQQGRVQARTRSLLEGNPVLEKWEADKRLQKKVEGLKGKLQVSGWAGAPLWAAATASKEDVMQRHGQVHGS